jgi:Holliday junction resolvase
MEDTHAKFAALGFLAISRIVVHVSLSTSRNNSFVYMISTDERKKKGQEAEEALRKMLDREGVAHLPFCENQDKVSRALKDFFATKRPDIMILFHYIGFILVEVKNKHPNMAYQTFLLDAEEAEKYAHFREVFGHEIWYAIANSDDGFKKWYWLPSLQATKGRKKISTKEGDCYSVPITHFIQVESFAKFTQMLLQTQN